jgi:CheY-like chemotaxis protein
MLRILVVDDDTAVRSAIKIVLEQDGHEVILASNGKAGIAAAEDERFDLVICDIFMPGMDGIETINTFHKNNPQMPVIAMSGFTFRDSQHPAPDYLSLSTKLGAAYSLASRSGRTSCSRRCANALLTRVPACRPPADALRRRSAVSRP